MQRRHKFAVEIDKLCNTLNCNQLPIEDTL